MFVLGCVFISEAFSLTMLWVFLPFMVGVINHSGFFCCFFAPILIQFRC